jgi:hypothetical protein
MGTSPTTPTPPAENAPALSQVERITNVFFSPSATFNDIKRSTSWWAPWLLMAVFGVVFVFAMQQKVGFRQIMQNEIDANPARAAQVEKLPPDQRERQMEIGAAITKYFSYGWPLFFLIVVVIIATVMMGTFNFGMGAEIPFGAAMAVVMYSFLPGILKSILGTIALYAGANPEGFNPRNPVATNLGFLLDRTAHPALYSLASSVDLLAIWMVILMGIGFACISKVKRSTAISVVAGWYVLVTLLGAGWMAVMS